MTTTSHTPGPWDTEGAGIVAPGRKETLASGRAVRLRIATCKDAGGNMPIHEVQANAALIAAAPELLEALRSILDGGIADPIQVIKAHAAIAKAEGR